MTLPLVLPYEVSGDNDGGFLVTVREEERMSPKRPAIDWFRITASLLVCAIHTSPLTSFTADGDFWLTRVLARVAVSVFLSYNRILSVAIRLDECAALFEKDRPSQPCSPSCSTFR